jgi:hypothetical protein
MGSMKSATKGLMDRYAIPAVFWLLVVLFVCELFNHLAGSDSTQPQLTKVTGQPTDVSTYLSFHLWELIYYSTDDNYPSKSGERLGCWMGLEHHV